MTSRVLVYGPAYLDRVLRVEGPLVGPDGGGPLDRSVQARSLAPGGPTLILEDSEGSTLEIRPPSEWPGPSGTLRLGSPMTTPGGWRREVHGREWLDDLGGMGAGFAKAFGGVLVSALGDSEDPMTARIRSLLSGCGIDSRPVAVPGRQADWTLLVTSGPSGDKLPVGFRGCHSAITWLPVPRDLGFKPELVVAAGLSNALVEPRLREARGSVRLWAPSLRSLEDSEFPPSRLAGAVDVMTCNREEWAVLADPRPLEELVWVRSVSDGPRGASVYFRAPDGSAQEVKIPAFPRDRPPSDTNRAGEAFASTLVRTLLDSGWRPGPADPELVRRAAIRASAASALVIGMERFGFPTSDEVDRAVERGRVS